MSTTTYQTSTSNMFGNKDLIVTDSNKEENKLKSCPILYQQAPSVFVMISWIKLNWVIKLNESTLSRILEWITSSVPWINFTVSLRFMLSIYMLSHSMTYVCP